MKNKMYFTSVFFIFYSLIGFNQTIDSNYFDIEHALRHIRAITNDSSKIDSLLQIAYFDFEHRDDVVPPPIIDNTAGANNRPGDAGVFDCVNGNWGFDDGTTSGWSTTGNVYVQNSGSDPYGNYPWVYPGGGSNSVKISGDQNSQKNGSLSRTINVPATGVTYFSFHFAMSIFNYPHTANAASKFRVEFFDQNANLIPCPNFVCYYSSNQGAQGVNNFQSTPNSASFYNPSANGDSPGSYGVTYTPWNDVTLDLSGYAGQTITVKFSINWCIYGPDWSYALVDVDCPVNSDDPFEICADFDAPYQLCSKPNMASYEWRDNVNNVLGNQECISISQPGTYFCDVLPNNVSCSNGSIITYKYILYENPVVDFDYSSFCFGEEIGLNNLSSCPTQTTCDYNWDFGDGTLSNDLVPNHTYANKGVYDITLNVESTEGCSVQKTKTIDVNSPTASFSFLNTCQDEVVAFTDASTPYGTTTLTSWNWDFGDGATSTTTSPNHTYTTPGTKDVTLSVESSDGCVATLSQSIDIYDLPVTNFTANDTCFGDVTVFTNQSTIANGTIASWAWDFGDGTTSTNQDESHIYTSDGSYQVSLISTSDNNCITSLTQQVEVFSEPLAAYSFTDDCLYEEVNFINNSSINTGQITDWNWDFGDGVSSTDESPNYTYSVDGTYTVTLIITSDNGCEDTLSQIITRYPIPEPNFTANSECLYTPINFNNTSTINAPDNIASWIWNFGDGSALSSDQTPAHTFPSGGDYNVTLIASSNNGCVATFENAITVYPVPIASFTSTTICENEPPTQFTNQSTITSGSIITTSWDFDDGNLSTLPNPVNYYSQAGDYQTQLIVISNFGCEDTIENPVTVLEKPTVEFVSDKLEGCSPLCVNLNDLSTTTNSSTIAWSWDFGNNETSNISLPNVCFKNLDNEMDTSFNIELTVTNDLGCSETLLKENYITVFHNPISNFQALPPNTNMYLSTIGFENNSIGADEYSWDFGDNNTSDLFELEHLYSDTGSYYVTLIVNTINNCADTSDALIRVDAVTSIYVPNTFTPNGDGNNDVFNVVGYNLKQAELSIFDRWGTLIYYTDDLTRGWDGEYKSTPAKTDTYIWKLKVIDGFGDSRDYKGHVLLLR